MPRILIIAVISFLTIGCVPKIKDFASYRNQPILKASHITKEDLEKARPAVVIMPFDNRDIEIAKNADLGDGLAVEVENILTESKLVDIIDRKAFTKLKDEVALSELSDLGSYKGPALADYAISGEVGEATFSHRFIEGISYFSRDKGTYINIPPMHRYKASFSGNIKIYELPSLAVKEVIAIADKTSKIENAAVDYGFFKREIKEDSIKKEDNALVTKAAMDALAKKDDVLKNIFSSYRKGYILAKKSNGKKIIFKINMGDNNALKGGEKVNIFTREKTANPLTEEEVIEKIKLGEGIVTNIVNEKSAWIIVKDKKIADEVKIGDFVTIIYKSGWF